MEIEFKSNKLRKICEDEIKLKRIYGDRCAKKIITRINELYAAENLYDISKLPQARLHLLKQNWKGHFAVDVQHPKRLIFLPLDGLVADNRTITVIKIIEVGYDYH